MSQELIELIIFGEIININEMVYFDYYTISIFIVILLMVLINKKINQEIYELRNFINFEINNLREQNIAIKNEFTENINNINCKIDKEIINIIEDMNYKFDILKAKFNSSELSRDELFKTFNEKINENSVIMNSVIERIDNFELNSQNNNIVIGIYYRNGYSRDRPFDIVYFHKPLYINLQSDTIEINNAISCNNYYCYYHYQLYITELLKLKSLKNIKLTYNIQFDIYEKYYSCAIKLTCDIIQTHNILQKDIFEPYKPKHYNDIKYFEYNGDNYIINTSSDIIAKLLKLKVYNNTKDCTEIIYNKVNQSYYNFLKLYFEEMGYISS